MIWQRVKNLWELSKYQAGKPTDEYKEPGTQIITLIQKPNKTASFIPYKKQTPIEKINNI